VRRPPGPRGVTRGAALAKVTGTASVTLPYPSLSLAYNGVGVSYDANPGAGNFDGSGYSYWAQALASVGITPGAAVPSGGYSFTWPGVAVGQLDDVTTAGQVIDLSGTGSQFASLSGW
jgi:beta-glucosidase